MREIRFRAWRTDEKYMVTSDTGVLTALRNCYGNKGLAEQARFSNIDNQPNPNKFILMQYTGLKDKNGKEIYEGDIIRHDWGLNKITFEDYSFTAEQILTFDGKYNCNLYLSDIGSDCEVIGNIYENPELLMGG